MTSARLLLRNLTFRWRSHLATAAGVAVASAVLVGALAVGDSVRASLRSLALARIAGVSLAVETPGRTFREELAAIGTELDTAAAPALHLAAVASTDDERVVPDLQLWGVDARFAALAPGWTTERDGLWIGEALADALDADLGDELVLRIEKPTALPREAPLSGDEEATIAAALAVEGIVPDSGLGRFSLVANHAAPRNAFVSLGWLQSHVGLPGRANVLLLGPGPSLEQAQAALRRAFEPDDAMVEIRELDAAVEVRSSRVFLEAPVVAAVDRAADSALRGDLFTYFVNELRVGENATPYSIVAGVEPGPPLNLVPADLAADEIVINDWLADDLSTKVGDRLEMKYFVLGPAGALVERQEHFRVRSVVPLAGPAADASLLPDFPGLTDKENCRDWEPGIPFDAGRIRNADEAYWDAHRGTPKAFVSLAAAKRMWANRFGDRTAVRLVSGSLEEWRRAIRDELDPASIGLVFRPIREQALVAGAPAVDFGGLFLGFSFVLLASALLLAGMLFSLATERRARESGTLLASGWEPFRVRRMLLLEGACVAVVGALAGAPAGVWYARGVLAWVAEEWRSAVALPELAVVVSPTSVAIGAGVAALCAVLAQAWTLWRRSTATARELLAYDPSDIRVDGRRSRFGLILPVITLVGALVVSTVSASGGAGLRALGFFVAGALLFTSVLTGLHLLLAPGTGAPPSSVSALAWRNASRRRGRTLGTVALLAGGTFLVVAVGANRHDAREATGLQSGTGGFALFGSSSVPLEVDPLSVLDADERGAARAVPLRVRDGDDASCLNLNQARRPTLLGVDPALFSRRFTFTQEAERGAGWAQLATSGEVVPAIGDEGTVTWGLKKQVGDELVLPDSQGRPVRIRIVGIIANALIQGALVIDDARFTRLFPDESGHRRLLVDAPAAELPRLRSALLEAWGDRGLVIEPAWRRLARFLEVENTYLGMFQALGALGLLLGCAGLGVVLLRNVLERRSELAILRATGFDAALVQRLVFAEHAAIAVAGVLAGGLAGLLAVTPALLGAGAAMPLKALATTLAGVLLAGLGVTWLATRAALRAPLLAALHDE